MAASRILRNWGFWLFSAASLVAFVILLRQDIPGHYRIFVAAAQALLHGQNPYGSTFNVGIGYYFYSPTCALVLFGPLSLLPEKIGLFVYMALSWAVFVFGAREFLKAYLKEKKLPSLWNWFWIAVASQMWGGILASKVEILMTGTLLLSSSWLLRGRFSAGAATLLAMILNWKFQPLPTVGLLLLAWVMIRRDWMFPLNLALSLFVWFRLPYYVMPGRAAALNEYHKTWFTTLQAFVEKAWLDFENLFAFLEHSLKVPLTYHQSQIISGAAGAILGACTLAWILVHRSRISTEELFKKALLLCLALGAMFTVAFSPLAQNNALIVYTPLLMAAFLGFSEAQGAWRETWRGLLVASWALMTFPYSDLVPEKTRDFLRYLNLKPLASIALALALIGFYFSSRPKPTTPLKPE